MQPLSRRTRHTISLQAARNSATDHPTVLDVIIPTDLNTLWNLLSDTHSGLLVQLHQALQSENFSIQSASPLAAHPHATTPAEDEVHLVLTFTTALPLVSLKAQNTEKVHLQRLSGWNSIAISSTCSTMGVPLGNCFLNKLEWHAEAVGANETHLTIKAHTEFIVPVFGVLRAQIERESLKGITNSYKIFDSVLKQHPWNSSSTSTTLATGALASPSLPPSATITNLNHPRAMSTSKFKHKQIKKGNNTNGVSKIVEAVADDKVVVLPELESTTSEEEDEDDRKYVESQDDEEEEEERLMPFIRPHKQTYFHFRAKSLEEIKALATGKWPVWADNRFWLLKSSSSHGGSEIVSPCPTPDEAVGIMWAITGYVSSYSHKKGSRLDTNFARDAFFKGLVECLRVSKARTPPQGPPRMLGGRGGNFGRGGRGGMKGRGGKNGAGGGKNSKKAQNNDTTKSDSTNTDTSTPTVPPVLSDSSITAAIFCIGYMESESEWSKELDALCSLIPTAKFFKVIEVYNIIWSLRSCRHWTPHLPILENAVVRLLEELDEKEWSRRQMRHASYCAQGLVHFGHVPKELLNLLAPRVEEHWDWRAACSLSWALTISNQLDSPLVQIIFKGIQDNADEALLNGFHKHVALSKIWQLVATLDRMRPGTLSKKTWNASTRKVIDLAESHWKKLIYEETKITSAVQKEVHRSMMSMGYSADLEVAVCGLSIDVAVQEIKLAVEVDGFAHFARNKANQAVGNSLWKKRFLEANGWIAVNVNVKDWYAKRGAGEKREFLKAAIEAEAERKKVKDAARLKKKNFWKRSFPKRLKARRVAAAKKKKNAATDAAATGVATAPKSKSSPKAKTSLL